eukprot:TRINITY_DN8861_c0_g1_i2.p1 TRINITY_DN8861_c0_g1~~TRINITY_DN8861_c0_g1_i2.p1  ORF type:complete len:226 (-),score=28.74 TRINITY_DN8861_c0_g1_i2:150-749(-)
MALLSLLLVGLAAGASGEACAEGATEEQCLLSLPPKKASAQLQSNSSEEWRSPQYTGVIMYDNSWGGGRGHQGNNFCLSVNNNQFWEGNYLQLWDCQWSSGQQFLRTNDYGKNYFTIGSGLTVGIPDGKWNGAKAKLIRGWQDFYWDGGGNSPGQLKAVDDASYCLVVDGNNAYNGARVQLWKCHEGQAYQKKWYFKTR